MGDTGAAVAEKPWILLTAERRGLESPLSRQLLTSTHLYLFIQAAAVADFILFFLARVRLHSIELKWDQRLRRNKKRHKLNF